MKQLVENQSNNSLTAPLQTSKAICEDSKLVEDVGSQTIKSID